MTSKPTIVLDSRDYLEIYQDLLARRPGYVPEWQASAQTAGSALGLIFARYLEAVLQRLNQAPDKNKLAFLDLLGLNLVPAQAARAPVVFQLDPQTAGGSAPAGTLLAAAAPPGSTDQILFETERAAGVSPGKILQVFSLWPGRDEYIDHSAKFAAGAPIQLFALSQMQPSPHQLYLAHETLLALAGNVEFNVEFELTQPSGSPLDVVWEYWDGKVWRGFRSLIRSCLAKNEKKADSTSGLTASGSYRLQADCAQASKTTVNGVEGFWLRGRLSDPLPPDPNQALAEVESIRLSSTVNQALTASLTLSAPYARPQVTSPQVPGVSSGFLAAAAQPLGLGGVVRNEAGQPVKGAIVSISDPDLSFTGSVTAPETAEDGRFSFPSVQPTVRFLFRAAFAGLELTARPPLAPSVETPLIDLTIAVNGLKPDKAFAETVKIDVTKPFYPLGLQPQPGSTFYFNSAETLSKPGAKVRIYLSRTESPQDKAAVTTASGSASNPSKPVPLSHLGFWEYWNSRQWTPIAVTSNLAGSQTDLDITEIISFTVPLDMVPVKVNDDEGLWIRFRLASGSYGVTQEVTWVSGPNNSDTNKFQYVVQKPPVLSDFRIGYTWQFGPYHPDQVFTYNDFRYEDHTYEASWPGEAFLPFQRLSDITPALYLGFDKPGPVDEIGIYFDIVETPGDDRGPALAWEYWDGFEWSLVSVEDETRGLRVPGIAAFINEADNTLLARFGTPLFWLRARLKEDGPPGEPSVNGIFPNAVWASQRKPVNDLSLGQSNGTPNQVFLIPQAPVLDGERIEVQELVGARANVEWRILALSMLEGDRKKLKELEDLVGQEGVQPDITYGDLRIRRDSRKRVLEVWVRWESKDQLFLSGPRDRHYRVDRALGRLTFGDGVNGQIPPPGAAIVVKEMRTGGGAGGNVAARKISQLLGVVPGVTGVFNPRAAEGGADGETAEAATGRAPGTVRHRGRAISPGDYETLAREASPAVGFARAIAGRNSAGRTVPGWVTLLIIPKGDEERPWPSFGLRDDVTRYIQERASADLAAARHIYVTGPGYMPIDVDVTLVPVLASEAGTVEKRSRQALERFLHPLYGGPGGNGWGLGRGVFLSDVAAVLERVEGLDFVKDLRLLKNSVPQGTSVSVPDRSIAVAGTIVVRVQGGEN